MSFLSKVFPSFRCYLPPLFSCSPLLFISISLVQQPGWRSRSSTNCPGTYSLYYAVRSKKRSHLHIPRNCVTLCSAVPVKGNKFIFFCLLPRTRGGLPGLQDREDRGPSGMPGVPPKHAGSYYLATRDIPPPGYGIDEWIACMAVLPWSRRRPTHQFWRWDSMESDCKRRSTGR